MPFEQGYREWELRPQHEGGIQRQRGPEFLHGHLVTVLLERVVAFAEMSLDVVGM